MKGRVNFNAAARPSHYDWPRFWIAQTGLLDLSDAGFLRDPVGTPRGGDTIRTLEDLALVPALALLGEPGIGKSTVLEREHKRRTSLSAETGDASVYVDLRVSSSEDALYRRVFEAPALAKWKSDASHLTLHLDSLDEALLRIETIANVLADALPSLPTERLSVRIACRTAIWPAATLGVALRSIWGAAGFQALELAPLRRRDVLDALAARGIPADEFVPKLFGAHAVPFAIKPLTLKMLLSLYESQGRLPDSTADLYRQACLTLSEEQNSSRRDTGRRGRLNAHQRLRLAGRIAAATILGRRLAVWTGPESIMPADDVAVSELAGAAETGSFPAFTASDDDVREVLDTGLFSSRGEGRMGWAHQSYGEFLAAHYLSERGVTAQTTLKILTHPGGGLYPPLAILGAWAASISPELRATLMSTDPWTLLRGDLANWDAVDRAALTDSLLCHVEQGRFVDYPVGIFEAFARLDHPEIADQLRAVIIDQSRKPISRRMALSIAERCARKELQPDLLRAAAAPAEDPIVRAASIAALRRCGDASAPEQILAVLRTGIAADPQQEIRGYALDLLWPDHIEAVELFQFITPSNKTFIGAYANFLFELPASLQRADLSTALTWATATIASASLTDGFRDATVADAIMSRAWDALDEPGLTEVFLDHVAARLHDCGELFRGTDQEAERAFVERLRNETPRRRTFLRSLLRRPIDRFRAHSYLRAGFLQIDDLGWLLEISPAGLSPVAGLDEDSVCAFVSLIFADDDNVQFELLYPALGRWPRLRAQFAFLIDGVAIDCEDAVQARARQAKMREFNERRPPPLVIDLPAEIESVLCRAEAGDWRAWWHLNLTLMLNPESRGIADELNYVITSMPGWTTADDAIRRRIVVTAERYLAEADSSADFWLGQKSMSLQRNDLAAMRALILLRQVDRDAYDRISSAAWAKWAPVIVGLPRKGVADHCEDVRAILTDALRKAPHSFRTAVRKILRLDITQSRAAVKASELNPGPHFFILRDLEGCWDDDGLKAAVFDEATSPDVQLEEYAALLDALLAVGHQPALDHGVAQLSAIGCRTTALADVLLRRAPLRAWPILRLMFDGNDDFARAVFARAGYSAIFATPFFVKIGEEAIADLYLLLEQLFPPASDPVGSDGLVSPLDTIPDLRDGAPRYLADLGTEQAVQALRRLVAQRPERTLLAFELSRGELAMRLKAWSPLTVREILAVTDRPDTRLVTCPADLLDVLMQTLAKFQAELQGAQTPVRDLWDRQGTSKSYRPIDENGLSDSVARYLRQTLGSAGFFANREVEVSRRPGDPVGKRTDILINTVRRAGDGRLKDSFAAVIEVKGSWNPELFTALKDQLVDDYMVRLNASVGLFLVGAFDLAQWDPADSRKGRVPRLSASEIQNRLDRQVASTPSEVHVRALVLAIGIPGS